MRRVGRRVFGVGSAACLAVVAGTALASPTTAIAATGCDLHAHPSGSDGASGSGASPLRTINAMVARLGPGQTGCLAGGEVFRQDVRIARAGSPGAPITLTSTPGGPQAEIEGRVVVTDAAHDVVVDNLVLDGSKNGQVTSPYVYGQRITFSRNDVSNDHVGVCFLIGSTDVIARDITLDGNRIHNCGKLPASNKDHGIYILAGRDTVIRNNYIYENADWGVHLYPDADGTLVTNNVLDANGSGLIFSGDHGRASSDNVVTKNLITNSQVKRDVEIWWPPGNPVGTGNVVRENCIHGGYSPLAPEIGYTASDNKFVAPGYRDAASHDYRIPDDSPCAGYGPQVPQEAPTPAPAAAPTPAAGRVCAGFDATIVGTPRSDRLRGTSKRDVVVALGGNDVILGRGGNDIVCAGPGRDRVVGGAGRDVILGGSGRDRLLGGPGNDLINGGPGADLASAHSGRDRLVGGLGNDRLFGGRGGDALRGSHGNDRLDGGPGRDVLRGQRGRDLLLGGAGADRLFGGVGRDIARGAGGPDRCFSSERRFSC